MHSHLWLYMKDFVAQNLTSFVWLIAHLEICLCVTAWPRCASSHFLFLYFSYFILRGLTQQTQKIFSLIRTSWKLLKNSLHENFSRNNYLVFFLFYVTWMPLPPLKAYRDDQQLVLVKPLQEKFFFKHTSNLFIYFVIENQNFFFFFNLYQ